MNRIVFLQVYQVTLVKAYPWARDESKLQRYMASVLATLDGANSWTCDGETLQAAWKSIGGKGKVTLKALRQLNKESAQ